MYGGTKVANYGSGNPIKETSRETHLGRCSPRSVGGVSYHVNVTGTIRGIEVNIIERASIEVISRATGPHPYRAALAAREILFREKRLHCGQTH